MPKSLVTQQLQSIDSIFTLMPDEYIRFEYSYKLGFCYFTTKTTTVTNMRLITHVIKAPGIFSYKTSPGKEKAKMVFLTDVNNLEQIKSAIPSRETKRWMKCLDILTCNCSSKRTDWLKFCHATDNLAMNNSNDG